MTAIANTPKKIRAKESVVVPEYSNATELQIRTSPCCIVTTQVQINTLANAYACPRCNSIICADFDTNSRFLHEIVGTKTVRANSQRRIHEIKQHLLSDLEQKMPRVFTKMKSMTKPQETLQLF